MDDSDGNARMCPIDETNLPRTPEIAIEFLRSLLRDLPPDWRLIADDRAHLLLIDSDDEPRGYIDLTHQRIMLLESVCDGNIDSTTGVAR
jgi:hypothetical protein